MDSETAIYGSLRMMGLSENRTKIRENLYLKKICGFNYSLFSLNKMK